MRLGIGLAVFFASTRALAQDVPVPPPDAPATAPQEVAPPTPTPEPEAPPPPPAPSIIVDAKDDRGHDVRSVTVLVDNNPVAYELEGKPIEVTPGPHTVTLQRNDGTHLRLSENVSLVPGQTAQPVHFRFSGHAVEEAQKAFAIRPDPPVLPRVVVGLGLTAMVAGAIVVLARPSSPANCDSTCTREAGQTDAQFAKTQSREQTHDSVTHAATGLIAGGGAATALGLLWYFIELPPQIQDAKAVSPWMTANGAGVAYGRSF